MESGKTRQELQELCERLEFLNGCLLRIGSGLDLDTVLQVAADGARSLVGARYGVIVTTDDAGRPQTFTTSGLTAEEMRLLQGWQQGGEQLFAHLRDLGRPVRLADWPGYVRSIGLSPHAVLGTCFMSVPMGSRGRQFGHFFLADKNDGTAFGDACEETLTLFATQVSNAIANARTYSSEQKVRAELEGVLDAAPTGLVVFRRRGEGPPLINREARRLMAPLAEEERSAEDILETLDASRPDGTVIDRDGLFLGESQWLEETELSMPGGRSVSVLASATPLRSAEGEIVSAVVAMQDLGPIRQRERMYHNFLAMVSHELRTPLSAITGSATTLLEDTDELNRAEMREFFRIIAEQADRMRALIGDLLDFGRMKSGVLSVAAERSDVRVLVERAKGAFANSGTLRPLCVELPPCLPPVMADPGRIAQVLGNLLSNAARHAPEGSTIRIAAAHEDPYVAVSVSDEGTGFTPERARLLFQANTGAANGNAKAGAGIGLAICKGLVEAHGGRIRAESPGPGLGATFTFTVPVAETGDEPADSAAPPAAERPARILIVDDDPHALRTLRDILRKAGFAPLVTRDHRDVPRLLRTERPELVLLDLALSGADGIDLLQRLPGLADLPVIVVSGYDREETIAKALDAGALDYVIKPCSPGELAARVRSALRRRKPANFVLGELEIDYGRRRVSVAGAAVELTATEYEILSMLSLDAGKVVTYDELLRKVWGRSESTDSSLVRMQFSGLRRKLGDDAENPTWIFNQRGVGYRMARPGES